MDNQNPNLDDPFAGLTPNSKMFEQEPFLGIIVADQIIPSTSEFNPSKKQWEHGIRPVRGKQVGGSGYYHEYAAPSDSDRSKLGRYLTAMKKGLRPDDIEKMEFMGGAGRGALIGAVAWFQRTNVTFQRGSEPTTLTLVVKRATDEEVAEAREFHTSNPITVKTAAEYAEGSGTAPSAGGAAASAAAIEWTQERAELAFSMIEGKSRMEIFSGLDAAGDDQALRAAVVGGQAAAYFVSQGWGTVDEAGMFHSTLSVPGPGAEADTTPVSETPA